MNRRIFFKYLAGAAAAVGLSLKTAAYSVKTWTSRTCWMLEAHRLWDWDATLYRFSFGRFNVGYILTGIDELERFRKGQWDGHYLMQILCSDARGLKEAMHKSGLVFKLALRDHFTEDAPFNVWASVHKPDSEWPKDFRLLSDRRDHPLPDLDFSAFLPSGA